MITTFVHTKGFSFPWVFQQLVRLQPCVKWSPHPLHSNTHLPCESPGAGSEQRGSWSSPGAVCTRKPCLPHGRAGSREVSRCSWNFYCTLCNDEDSVLVKLFRRPQCPRSLSHYSFSSHPSPVCLSSKGIFKVLFWDISSLLQLKSSLWNTFWSPDDNLCFTMHPNLSGSWDSIFL